MAKKRSLSYQQKKIEAVIFDMDGTLYNQLTLRIIMTFYLSYHFFTRPHKLKELIILFRFRKMKESMPFKSRNNKEEALYEAVAKKCYVPTEKVRSVVNKWILNEPLAFLQFCKERNVIELLKRIDSERIPMMIVSDYPADLKIKALGIPQIPSIYTLEKKINAPKPHPKSFLAAAEKMQIIPERVLVIGDREEKDGEGARNAGMQFILKKDLKKESHFLTFNE